MAPPAAPALLETGPPGADRSRSRLARPVPLR